MALHLHIHTGRRVRTIDLTPPSLREQYKQLVARLMEIMERQSTHDDAQPGHPFYGNQYTDVVLGPKPTEAKSKGVKNIVHELLTSGHPFTFEELKAATGAKLDQQLHNAINELKAGKHAAGALGIVKIGPGQYQVVKPGGEPAKALAPKIDPDDELVSVPYTTPAEKAQEAPKAPDLPNPPAPPAPSEPSPVSAPPLGPLGHVATAPATKMTKAEADKVYNEHLEGIHEEAASMMVSGNFEAKEAAQFWKGSKAKAMAQWKANTTGVDQKPLPVDVFKEDEDLMFGLAKAYNDYGDMPTVLGDVNKSLMEKWKEATHKAKAAKPIEYTVLTPDVPVAPEKPAAATTPEALKGPLSFEVPKAIVPEGHKGISVDDFITQPGHSESGYVKGIAELHKKLHASASDAVSNKIAVEHGLTKRLKDSPHFQNMREQYKKKMGGSSLEAAIISTWAGSSGDHSDRAVSAQLACRDVFGMDPNKTETKAFGSLQSTSGDEDAVHKKAAKEYGVDVSTPEKLASYKKGMQDFMLAQYHETQDHLDKLGIKELHLVRGMKFGAGGAAAQMVNLKLQPASSFSTEHGTAKSFAGGHSLFVVKVPASQVLGSFCTGYGCTSESEVVVLNHENLKAIQIGAQVGATTTQMSSHIKQYAHNLGGTKTSVAASKSNPLAFKPKGLPTISSTGLSPQMALKAKAAYKAAEEGDIETLTAIKNGSFPSTLTEGSLKEQGYVETLHKMVTEQKAAHESKIAGASASISSAPDSVASPPAGTGSLAKQAHELAKNGDLQGLLDMASKYSGQINIPKTKKYIKELIANHKAVIKATEGKTATASKPVPTTAEGVKKNAHYYKKLKEKVIGHEMHSEAMYNALKKAGLTHEQVLETYNKAYQSKFGEPA